MVFSSLFGGPPDIEKLKTKGDINGLIKALGYEKDADIRLAAAQALREVDRTQLYLQAKEPFIDALKDEDWRVRQIAIQVLAELGEPDTLGPIVKALEDQNPQVQETAVEALAANVGSSRLPEDAGLAVVEFLGRTGDARYVEALISAFRHAFQMNYLSVQHAARDALVGLGSPAVQPLCGILGEQVGIGTKPCHKEVIEILVRIGDRQAVAPLITVLKEDPNFSSDAAKALGKFGGPEAVEALLSALGDRRDYMRATAAEALGEIGDARAIEPLKALQTTDEEEIVRKAAAAALRHMELEPVQDGDGEATGQIEDIADVTAIEAAIEDLSQPSTRVRGAQKLGEIGDALAISPLLVILTQEPVITETGFPAAAQQRWEITNSKSAALRSLQAILQRDAENIDLKELNKLATLNDLEGWEGVVDSTGYFQGVDDITLDCSPLRNLAKQELSRRGVS